MNDKALRAVAELRARKELREAHPERYRDGGFPLPSRRQKAAALDAIKRERSI